jgi:hypothetical protein
MSFAMLISIAMDNFPANLLEKSMDIFYSYFVANGQLELINQRMEQRANISTQHTFRPLQWTKSMKVTF